MTTDDGRRYRPDRDEEREFWRKLDEVIVWSLHKLREQEGQQIAEAVAERLDRRQFRLMTSVDIDRNGEPDIDSLSYRVEVAISDGWLKLVEARWPALGVSEEGAREEARMTLMQHGYGIPDDLSKLLDPPSGDPEA